MKVAQTFNGSNVSFAISDSKEFEQELSVLGVAADPSQPTVIGRDTAGKAFAMGDEFS